MCLQRDRTVNTSVTLYNPFETWLYSDSRSKITLCAAIMSIQPNRIKLPQCAWNVFLKREIKSDLAKSVPNMVYTAKVSATTQHVLETRVDNGIENKITRNPFETWLYGDISRANSHYVLETWLYDVFGCKLTRYAWNATKWWNWFQLRTTRSKVGYTAKVRQLHSMWSEHE